jgi:hypothetical protein
MHEWLLKSYILGYYAHSDHLLETLSNEKRRRMLKALLDSHPKKMNIKDIASKGKISVKTAYGADYLGRMSKDGFIKEVDESEETGGSHKYVFEDVNSLTRHSDIKYRLAPGNVEYTEEFKRALHRLISRQGIEPQIRSLLNLVKYIVESVKESDEEQIAPKEDGSNICSTCGLNHEARDFIRATLQYLLDQFERNTDYLEFLREKNYIDNEHYDEYHNLIQTNLTQLKPEGILTEKQFTPSGTNAGQTVVEKPAHRELLTEGRSTESKKTEKEIVAEKWFEKKKGLTKNMIEYVLSKKPEFSMTQIKILIDRHRMKNRSRSDLDAIHGVAEHLGVFLSDDLVLRYDKRKRQEDNEKRTRQIRNDRRRKRRLLKRSS